MHFLAYFKIALFISIADKFFIHLNLFILQILLSLFEPHIHRLLLNRVHFPYFPELIATGLYFLCLKSSFDNVHWVSQDTCKSTCYSCAKEIPQVRVCLIPWLKKGLKVLIYTNYNTRKWQVHENCDWIRTIQTFNSIFSQDVLNTLGCCQFFAKL